MFTLPAAAPTFVQRAVRLQAGFGKLVGLTIAVTRMDHWYTAAEEVAECKKIAREFSALWRSALAFPENRRPATEW